MRLLVLALLAFCAAAPPAVSAPVNPAKEAYLDKGYRPLTGAEIRELVSGNTVEGRYNYDVGTFAEFYAPDGRVTTLVNGKDLYRGKWSIEGDRLCFIYPEDGDATLRCIEQVMKDGHILDFRTDGPTFGEYWSSETVSITPGNVKNLPLE
jgi:hypothetical protein